MAGAEAKKRDNVLSLTALKKKMGTMAATLSRAALLSRLGKQYGGDRDIYQALGYKLDPTYEDYLSKYKRNDMGGAIINRPVDATWRGGFTISDQESGAAEESEFEKAWKGLDKQLKLTSVFRRQDKLTALGRYGVLFLGFDDASNPRMLKTAVDDNRQLMYVKPLGEGHAKVHTLNKNTSDPRYGLPETYKLTIVDVSTDREMDLEVHHSRVIHITKDLLEDENLGTPDLERPLNRIYDLEKIVGGSAEMFWRGARPGYTSKVDDDFEMTQDVADDLQDQLNEYENNLRRFLQSTGVTISPLETQVSSPSEHVQVQLQMISADKGIPIRILVGSERGELASTEDRDNWFETVKARREQFAEPEIVRAFIDKCVAVGALPAVESYEVEWSDLWSQSEKDLADVGRIKAEALKFYTTNPMAQVIMPPDIFYKHILSLTEAQIKEVEDSIGMEMANEQDDFGGEED